MALSKQFSQLLPNLDVPEHPFIPPVFHLKTVQEFVRRAASVHSTNISGFSTNSSDASNNSNKREIETFYGRLLAAHNTGSGKTRTALEVAQGFVAYHRAQARIESPLVYIIGYSRSLFIRELLRWPDFGFVTQDELNELAKIQRLAATGTSADADALKHFMTKLKKRLSNPKWGGHYRFLGFKEFYNLLFRSDDLRPGHMQLNEHLIINMANCIVLIDEMQLLYNSVETNNLGMALRIIGQIYSGSPDVCKWCGPLSDECRKIIARSTLYMVFLSATPAADSQNFIDLINVLVRPQDIMQRFPATKSRPVPIVERSDFFDKSGELLPGALANMVKLTSGYVSYIYDINPEYYPQKLYAGVAVPNIPYIKFTLCVMPPKLAATYRQVVSTTLPAAAEMLLDGAVEINNTYYYNIESLRELGAKTLAKHGVEIVQDADHTYLSGAFLLHKLPQCFPKYAKMLEIVRDIVRSGPGKIFISHQRVTGGSGVRTIMEILMQNGILDTNSTPNENTWCNVCSKTMREHNKKGAKKEQTASHEFIPVRAILVYGEMDRASVDRKISMYGSRGNLYGEQYRILLGSKKLNVGYDFEAIQYQLNLSVTDDAAEYLQRDGRGARTDSHKHLPADQRKITIHNLVSVLKSSSNVYSSYDLTKYERIFRDYAQTQQISAEIYKHAIDAQVVAQILARSWGADMRTGKLSAGVPKRLGAVYFPLDYSLINRRVIPQQDSGKFSAFFAEDEIVAIMYIIKQLFVLHRVYMISDLEAAVHSPGFRTELDPRTFSRNNYLIALRRLLSASYFQNTEQSYSRLSNHNDTVMLYRDTTPYKLICTKNFLYTVAIDGTNNISTGPESWNRSNVVRREPIQLLPRLTITENYQTLRQSFQKAFGNATWYQLMGSLETYDEDFHKQLIEDCIKYVSDLLSGAGRVSEHHEFYYRMLYFYAKLDLVLYADQLPETITIYHAMTAPERHDTPHTNRFLMESLTKANSNFDLYKIAAYRPAKHKVPANLLPVGHFITNTPWTPQLYHPQRGWHQSAEYIDSPSSADVENNIIIGKYEKIPGSIELRFKLNRPQKQLVKHDDLRFNARGIICVTENKTTLRKLKKALGIQDGDNSARMDCAMIKLELFERELASRRAFRHEVARNPNAKRVRWFIMHFER